MLDFILTSRSDKLLALVLLSCRSCSWPFSRLNLLLNEILKVSCMRRLYHFDHSCIQSCYKCFLVVVIFEFCVFCFLLDFLGSAVPSVVELDFDRCNQFLLDLVSSLLHSVHSLWSHLLELDQREEIWRFGVSILHVELYFLEKSALRIDSVHGCSNVILTRRHYRQVDWLRQRTAEMVELHVLKVVRTEAELIL